MKRVRAFLHRLLAAFIPGGREELARELETHLDLMTEDNVRQGMTPEVARREAILRLGQTQSIVESWHDQRVLSLLDTVPRDLRLAVRRFSASRASQPSAS